MAKIKMVTLYLLSKVIEVTTVKKYGILGVVVELIDIDFDVKNGFRPIIIIYTKRFDTSMHDYEQLIFVLNFQSLNKKLANLI